LNQPAAKTDKIYFDAAMLADNVLHIRREEALYFEPQKLASVLESPARMARDVHGLLKILTAINAIRGLIGLERPLFELILDVIPAQRGAIVLNEKAEIPLAPVLAWDTNESSGPLPICKQMTDRALRDTAALLSNDLQDPDGTRRSAMAAPLVVFDRVIGFIYLDNTDPKTRFDAGNLHMLVVIAAITATVLENARHLQSLERENERLRHEIHLQHAMVGESPRMLEIYQFIGKVARSDSTILLLGESGTGKELVARAIHQNSLRSAQPFVAINCAAITETLLESELFGYEKGAFTGANTQTRGKLEVAEHGTVFLDEIGELAPTLQAKLLRVLQEHEFTRVGGTRAIKLNVRLIAATNRNLEEAVRQNVFRRDLYYRLNVVSKSMPPLRERREDIPQLAAHFLRKYSAKAGRRIGGISPQAQACLLNYNWPGNVRELENAIERAIVLGSAEIMLPEDLPESLLEVVPSDGGPQSEFHVAVRQAKRQLILAAMASAKGNYTKAAKHLGLHPNYLHRLIRNLDLHDDVKRPQ
jgi:transcriptional regulator with GAF, ATPase, and Fis domain